MLRRWRRCVLVAFQRVGGGRSAGACTRGALVPVGRRGEVAGEMLFCVCDRWWRRGGVRVEAVATGVLTGRTRVSRHGLRIAYAG